MLFKYCFKLYITQGILLHTLHGHTYTLNLHVQVYIYPLHCLLLLSLHLSILFTLREKGICPT